MLLRWAEKPWRLSQGSRNPSREIPLLQFEELGTHSKKAKQCKWNNKEWAICAMWSSSSWSERPLMSAIKAATLSTNQTMWALRRMSLKAISPCTTARSSSCAIFVSKSSHKRKTEESMWITAPNRAKSWALSNNPALPWRGASCEASLATTTRRRWLECRLTIRLGWKARIARTSSNTLESEAVIVVWDS